MSIKKLSLVLSMFALTLCIGSAAAQSTCGACKVALVYCNIAAGDDMDARNVCWDTYFACATEARCEIL